MFVKIKAYWFNNESKLVEGKGNYIFLNTDNIAQITPPVSAVAHGSEFTKAVGKLGFYLIFTVDKTHLITDKESVELILATNGD